MAGKENPLPRRNKMGRPEHWTPERVGKLTDSLEKHVKNPNSYDILEWRGKEKLTRQVVLGICQKDPDFRDAYEIAKAVLGSRRQKMALTGDWNATTVHRDDWAYDADIKARQDELRQDPKDSATNPCQIKEANSDLVSGD